MSDGKLTLDDIARMAGVSRATASRIINGKVGTRSKARDRVLKIMEETDYQPHAAARSLASERTSIIGLVVPTPANFVLSDPFSVGLIEVVAQACNTNDYTLALFIITSEDDEQKLNSRIARWGLLDGVILVGGPSSANGLISKLLSIDLPLVVSSKDVKNFPNVSYVEYDQERGAFSAVTHLIRLGRRRAATITGLLSTPHGAARLEGYRKAVSRRGLRADESLIVNSDFTEEGGYYAARRLLGAKPDGIFVASDRMAKGAMRALHEAGLRVPDDVAVVGFDDLPLALETDPPLTTVHTSLKQLGTNLVEVLIDIINNGNEPPRRIMLESNLVIRGSCGAYRSSSGDNR